jgi:23S rRNA pseudouridine1911/1915/1917 synthase
MSQPPRRSTSFTVPESEAGRRLDVVLTERLARSSRSLIQKYIEEGAVLVNEASRKPNYRLKAGDNVEVSVPEPKPTALVPANIPLEILYEDDELLVINKPPGLPVHPGAGHARNTITNALLHHIGESGSLSNIGGESRPGIVHRLDKDTAGVLVVAKTNHAHEHLSRQFAGRTTVKVYEAIVKGVLLPSSGVIDKPIARSAHNRKKFAVLAHGKEAVTRYTVLDAKGGTSLVRFIPKTGRTHQLRVHAASIGHPIIGDPLYSRKVRRSVTVVGEKPALPSETEPSAGTIALFARSLTFRHPLTGESMTFSAPYPPHFADLARRLGYKLESL